MIHTSNRSVVEKSFAHHAARIIGRLKRLDPSGLQSGDSRLVNGWEEYKVQIQLEQSLFFSLYNDTIRRIVEEAVDSMHPKTVVQLGV